MLLTVNIKKRRCVSLKPIGTTKIFALLLSNLVNCHFKEKSLKIERFDQMQVRVWFLLPKVTPYTEQERERERLESYKFSNFSDSIHIVLDFGICRLKDPFYFKEARAI